MLCYQFSVAALVCPCNQAAHAREGSAHCVAIHRVATCSCSASATSAGNFSSLDPGTTSRVWLPQANLAVITRRCKHCPCDIPLHAPHFGSGSSARCRRCRPSSGVICSVTGRAWRELMIWLHLSLADGVIQFPDPDKFTLCCRYVVRRPVRSTPLDRVRITYEIDRLATATIVASASLARPMRATGARMRYASGSPAHFRRPVNTTDSPWNTFVGKF